MGFKKSSGPAVIKDEAKGNIALRTGLKMNMPGKGFKTYLIFYFWAGIVAFILTSPYASRADKFNTETSSSARSLAMGGTGINTERGPNSVFYNPANIAAKKTGVAFQVLNFTIEGNDNLVRQIGDSNYVNFTNLADIYATAKANTDQFIGGRFSVYPNFTIRNLSFGLLYEKNEGAMVSGETGELIIRARDRLAPTGALSFRFMNGILRVGGSAQLLTVGESTAIVRRPEASAEALSFSDHIDSGSGLVFNAGGTLTLPMRYLPSFSVVIRNLTNTSLTSTPLIKFGEGSDVPEFPFLIDAGSSVRFHLDSRLVLKVEVDYKDWTNELDGNLMRHIFAGGELSFYDTIQIRGGYAHGYISAGIGLSAAFGTLDLAWYSDEIADRYRDHRDQRFALQYSYSLFGTKVERRR